ncbi:MAG: histidine kinase dimerization/phospho-acceptor domain-containing protein [candidate division Zixibacteria bacterium]
MDNSASREELKYRALAGIAVAAIEGVAIDMAARRGLAAAMRYIELNAGAMLLWDENGKILVKAVEANLIEDKQTLLDAEESILNNLRREHKLGQAYMEFGGETEKSLFTVPLEIGSIQFGAVIGIKDGKARLHEHDDFLKALAAVMALAAGPKGTGEGMTVDEVDKKVSSERNAARVELAVAVNHHINNPLTALLGNLQLLSLKHQDLPEDVQKRLEVIENSARQISEVTKRLMSASQAETTEYINGLKMTDFFGEGKENNNIADEDNKEG